MIRIPYGNVSRQGKRVRRGKTETFSIIHGEFADIGDLLRCIDTRFDTSRHSRGDDIRDCRRIRQDRQGADEHRCQRNRTNPTIHETPKKPGDTVLAQLICSGIISFDKVTIS
ncbi:hypothetical protein [Microbacterium tumbae]